MTPGQTSEQAAAEFLAEHGRVFGAGQPEVRELWRTPTNDGAFEVFAYLQQIRGTDVDGSSMRIKVRRGELPRVDYVAASLAREPVLGLEHPVIPVELAVALLHAQPGFGDLLVRGQPEQVVLLGSGVRPDAWCWRIRTSDSAPRPTSRTFFVETGTAQVIHVRDEVAHGDSTTGSVKAPGTPALSPWHPYIPNVSQFVQHAIPRLGVTGTLVGGGEATAFTSGAGNFVLQLGTTGSPITVSTGFDKPGDGYYWPYDPCCQAQFITASQAATVGAHVDLTLANPTMSEEIRVAQADVTITVDRARTFFQEFISTSLPGSATEIKLRVPTGVFQIACNAIAHPPWSTLGDGAFMLEFGTQGNGCWSFASHGVTAHEYGHAALWIIHPSFTVGGPGSQAHFHEGFADTYANMLNDDSVQGRNHYMNGGNIRNDPASVNCQYPITAPASSQDPCSCQYHAGGQLLSGVWVRIRQSYKDEFGTVAGLYGARKLFGMWSLVTLGQELDTCNSAHEGTAMELWSLLGNGKEMNIVCNAFVQHNIPCPE